MDGYRACATRALSSFTWLLNPTWGYFQYNHLALRSYFLTDEFSPVRRARSILAITEVLTKSHVVVFFIKSLDYSLASSSHYCLAFPACRLRLISHLKVSR